MEPQTFDPETRERRQVASVDGWQHCLLARQRQLAVPAVMREVPNVLLQSDAAVRCILVCANYRKRTFFLLF